MLDPVIRQVRADLRHAKVLVDRAERARVRKEATVDYYRDNPNAESVLESSSKAQPRTRQQSRKARATGETGGESKAGGAG